MPKINVYLPDDLADAVRDTGVPVSAICQRALEQAVRRMTAIRQVVLTDLDAADLTQWLPQFTARAVAVLGLAIDRAKQSGAANVGTGDLLHGMLAEGANLGLKILTAMEVPASALTVPPGAEPSLPGPTAAPARPGAATSAAGAGGPAGADGLRFSAPAAVAVELAATEATGLGHNYVGCEHLLIGLSGEPDGGAGTLLRAKGADAKATRRAVATILAGYSAGYARVQKDSSGTADLLTAVRAELAPLVERIERLEAGVR